MAAILVLATGSPAHALEVELVSVISGLSGPVDFVQPADKSGRRFVVEQNGVIHVLNADGKLEPEPFLDLRDRLVALERAFDERGLLGFALHPDFARNRRVYVSYTAPLRDGAPRGWNNTRRLSEFTVAFSKPGKIDVNSERVLLELDWPSHTHNGGGLAFGPDGYLYIGLGDGGGAREVGNKEPYSALDLPPERRRWHRLAQDVTSLLGSILRIDVDSGFPGYGVPADNPFVGRDGRDEIYAWGFRNPYRIAFDRAGRGDMLVTAPAKTFWEAIYLVDRPGNYGWPLKEGAHCVDPLSPENQTTACPRYGANGYPIEDPVVEYPNMLVENPGASLGLKGVGTAVVGMRIYRGSAIPELEGKLVFADWSASVYRPSGGLFLAAPPKKWRAPWQFEKILEIDTRIVGIAQDLDGEIYLLTDNVLGPYGKGGEIFKLVPSTR